MFWHLLLSIANRPGHDFNKTNENPEHYLNTIHLFVKPYICVTKCMKTELTL